MGTDIYVPGEVVNNSCPVDYTVVLDLYDLIKYALYVFIQRLL
jgi:hypothetical protein